ncbi:PepSY domain-containing protein [Neobacillus sp. DY30]|uniref:PepSY domain-containing protein n=1 Tax=Neobacillus sp. DY30 TaxID=3047871 RepID=UPI0024BFF2B1|nr:PepSY domain-containing protein [Neobacillus sp. DY30]WHY02141.1 PepSY domain-containing protein [Neobacillus sp. DY30]
MKKLSWFWVTMCTIIVVIVFVSWQQFGKLSPSADMLTKKEAEELVQDRYQGKVTLLKLADQQYQVELQKQTKLYVIKLDAKSGKILSFDERSESTTPTPDSPLKGELPEEELKQIVLNTVNGSLVSFEKIVTNQHSSYKAIVNEADKQTTIIVDASSGAILSTTSTLINEPPKRLTENEAVTIAKSQVQGELDDIWLATEGNQTFYLVKIETNDDREATVQIHAITGDVLSVSWDDHTSEQKENDNNDDD